MFVIKLMMFICYVKHFELNPPSCTYGAERDTEPQFDLLLKVTECDSALMIYLIDLSNLTVEVTV